MVYRLIMLWDLIMVNYVKSLTTDFEVSQMLSVLVL